MGSYENIVKIEEIRRRFDEGDFLSAQKVLDTMELKKVKNITDLNLIAEVYETNDRYEEAVDFYLKIYEKVKSRKSLYHLIEVLIKLNNVEDAEHYLLQYKKIAPRDFYNYIFLYKIKKSKGEAFANLIEILEDLKKEEYTEIWAYELAKLYYKAGMEKECIQECSDLELWFGEGIYVEKAKILKSYYSGETDKDKIMEEIKRRADVVNQKVEQTNTQQKKDNIITTAESTEDDCSSEGDPYSHADFMLQDDVDQYVDGLKKDVQSIMIDEPSVEITNQNDDENSKDDDISLQQFGIEFKINLEEIFGNFLHITSIKKQLAKTLDNLMHDDSKTIMLSITGAKGSGKTTLAKDFALFLLKTGKLNSSKIAKIKADKLNNINLMKKKETLKDCCMVIENACELNIKTIDSLLELLQVMNGDLAVILEDEKKNLNKLFKECPRLVDIIKSRLHIPHYVGEDLVGFAYSCLNQKNYQLSPKAEQVLLSKVNQIAEQSEPQRQLEQICDLMQAAMDTADFRIGKQLSNLASQELLSDVEVLTIQEVDFL